MQTNLILVNLIHFRFFSMNKLNFGDNFCGDLHTGEGSNKSKVTSVIITTEMPEVFELLYYIFSCKCSRLLLHCYL